MRKFCDILYKVVYSASSVLLSANLQGLHSEPSAFKEKQSRQLDFTICQKITLAAVNSCPVMNVKATF